MNMLEYTLPENLSSAIGSLFFDDHNQQIAVSFRGDTKYMYSVNGDYDSKRRSFDRNGWCQCQQREILCCKILNQMKSKNRLVEI